MADSLNLDISSLYINLRYINLRKSVKISDDYVKYQDMISIDVQVKTVE